MDNGKIDPKKLTPNELKVQLEVAREKLSHKEEEVLRLERELEKAHLEVERLETELEQTKKALNELRMQYEVTKEKYEHTVKELSSKVNDAYKRNSGAKVQAVFVSIAFLGSNILLGFGVNMLTMTPPDPKGPVLLAAAVILSLLGTGVSIFVGGNNL
jgi:hypothetical protein